jgi:ATP-dependent RNA helicase DDX54/DBP10
MLNSATAAASAAAALTYRCGRAARAGRPGSALSLLTRDELPYLLDLHLFLSRQLAPAPLSPEQGLVDEAAAAMAAAGGMVAAAAAAGAPSGGTVGLQLACPLFFSCVGHT